MVEMTIGLKNAQTFVSFKATTANKRFCASGVDGKAIGIRTNPGSGRRATDPLNVHYKKLD